MPPLKPDKKSLTKNEKIVVAILLPIALVAFIFPQYYRSKKIKNNSSLDQTNQSSEQKEMTKSPSLRIEYVLTGTGSRGTKILEYHFIYSKSDIPKEDHVKEIIRNIADFKKCPEDKLCDYMLWSSKEAWSTRITRDVVLSNEYAKDNLKSLIGYLNSGGLFYYYGQNEQYFETD